jgi:Ca2+-binding EF-hand superfamily protein
MEDAKKNAAALLLMMDKDDKRVLTYEKFAKLIMGTAATFEMTFDELADQLTYALTNPSEISDEVMQEIMVAESAYEEARDKENEMTERKMTLDALSYSRTQKLFDLWDSNGDGDIDFQELMSGLRRYQKAAQVAVDVERDAVKIMGYDKDSNQTLDKEEFAYAMANYAEAVETDLHEMIDFMCVVASQSDSANQYELTYTEATLSSKRMSFAPSRFESGLGTILDMEADDDSEAEEDDF